MRYIFILILFFTLTACGFSHHAGNAALYSNDPAQVIINGKTTKTDLIAAYGPPQTTQKRTVSPEERNNPNLPASLKAPETWIYWSNKTEGASVILPFMAHTTSSSSINTLVVYLDESGTVLDYASSQTNN